MYKIWLTKGNNTHPSHLTIRQFESSQLLLLVFVYQMKDPFSSIKRYGVPGFSRLRNQRVPSYLLWFAFLWYLSTWIHECIYLDVVDSLISTSLSFSSLQVCVFYPNLRHFYVLSYYKKGVCSITYPKCSMYGIFTQACAVCIFIE